MLLTNFFILFLVLLFEKVEYIELLELVFEKIVLVELVGDDFGNDFNDLGRTR